MEALRQFLKGWLGKILLVIFLAPLALLGIESYFTSRSNTNMVATVGEVHISSRELDKTIMQERKRIADQLNGNEALIDDDKLKTQVLNSLIDKNVLQQQAQHLGLNLSDAQITALIQKDPSFHDETGKFSQSRFQTLLKNNGLDKGGLFHNIRTQSSLSQLARGIGQTAIFPKYQLDKLIALQREQRHVRVHRISVAGYASQVSVTDKEVAAYYEKHKAELNTQKTIDLDYVVLSSEKFAGADVSAEELQQAYQAHLQELSANDERKASHILLTGKDAPKKAADVLARIKKGEDFSTLAKTLSEDSASKTQGGALDYAGKGVYDPAFEKTLFSLKKGEISDVVISQYGAHIIRLDDIKAASVPTIEEMKASLTAQMQLRKQEDAYQDAIKRINEDAINGKAVKDIAADETLMSETVKDFTDSAINPATLMGKTELMHPDVMKKAFDEFALTDQTTSVGISVAPNKTVWLQSRKYRPVRTKTLEEATKEIKARLINDAAMKLVAAQANKVVTAINASHDLAAVSKSMNITFDDMGDISRQVPLLGRTEMATAFSVGLDGTQVVAADDKTEDGYTVLAVSKATKPDTTKVSDEQKKQLAQQFREIQGQQQFADYIEYAKSQFKVERNEKVLNESADN